MPKKRNRYFSLESPLMYNGSLYPAAETSILNEDGTTTKRNIGLDANGSYFYVENGQPRTVDPLYNLDEVTVTGKMPASIKAENLQKQAYMRAAGYDVPNDGSWNEQQQSIWDSLTIRPKEYDTTLTGFATGLWDKLTGNTTERTKPFNQGEINPYDPNKVDWSKTRNSQNKVVNAMSGTWGPLVAAAAAPALASSMVTAPIPTMAMLAGGYAGGYAVDKASEALTGRDFGTNVSMHTPLTPGMGDMLNLGYIVGGWTNPRVLAATDVALTTLTGKSRDWMKPLVKNYIGEAYYANIRPSGYANNSRFASSRKEQVKNMLVDFLKPKAFRNNVSNPDYRPKWFIDKDNPSIFEMFRNDAHRLSMGLEPHKELLPDGKLHSLYVKKPNGNYDVDWDYIRHVKQKYTNNESAELFRNGDFPIKVPYATGSPQEGKVVANDLITGNGGFGTYEIDPSHIYTIPTEYSLTGLPSTLSTKNVTFKDTWDVQPLSDSRSILPKTSQFLTDMENKEIPLLSNMAKNIKNVDLVDALGGKPFVQESILPNQTIEWVKSKKSIEEIVKENKKDFEFLTY